EELSAAVLAVAAHREVRDVLQTIVGTARALLDADYAALGVPDDQGGFAEFVVDGVSDEQWAAIGPLPRQHGMLGVMMSDPVPQRLPDLRADPRFGWWPPAHPVLHGFIGMPILDGGDSGEILGAVYLANPRGRDEFSDHDERLLGVLAAHAAIALTNARLFEADRELTLVQERQRIARELHDAVAQTLFSLRLTAQAAAALVRRDPDRAADELDAVAELANTAADELRAVVAELRPRELTHAGLVETLRARIALLDRVHDATVTLEAQPICEIPARVEETVLRIAEESLHNALRHAEAKHVTVRLRCVGPDVVLEITDDGSGFDTHGATGSTNRLGLVSMRERARTVRGSLAVESSIGGGTTVTLTVPRD
ncbi:MAG TPA: GAF domain-containing sensor histidine kinase, partial [Micromonosporaceae bacterium]